MRNRENYRTPKKTVNWENKIRWQAAKELDFVGEEPAFEGQVYFACRFTFHKHNHGDLSNYLKAAEDALNGADMKFTRETLLGGKIYARGERETIGKAWVDDKKVRCLGVVLNVDKAAPKGVDIVIADPTPEGLWFVLESLIHWEGCTDKIEAILL